MFDDGYTKGNRNNNGLISNPFKEKENKSCGCGVIIIIIIIYLISNINK